MDPLLRHHKWCNFYYLFLWLFRVTDEIFNFLLVWYYCTLTIRESILMSNGSRCAFSLFYILKWVKVWYSDWMSLHVFPGLKAGGCLTIMYPRFCLEWCWPGELHPFVPAYKGFDYKFQLICFIVFLFATGQRGPCIKCLEASSLLSQYIKVSKN